MATIPRSHKSGPAGFINVEIVGDSRGVEGMLRHLDTAMSAPAIAAMLSGTVGPYLRERAQARFASEGDDVVGRWRPLAPATEEIRARGQWPVGPAHPINVRTGQLMEYITEGTFDDVTPHSLGATLYYPSRRASTKAGGLAEKVKTAQEGRAFPNTPPRPVLGVGTQDISAILAFLAFHIKGRGFGAP